MSRKCPPGVICFENTTIVVFLVITGIILYLAYMQFNKNSDGSMYGSMSTTSGTRTIYDTDPSRSGVYTYPPAYGAVGLGSVGGGGGGGGGGNFLDLIPRHGGGGGGYTRGPADVLLNPYTPPLRDSQYIGGMGVNSIGLSGGGGGGGIVIPINVPTRSVNSSYRQVGILTRVNGPETILSLMGRPLFPSQDKWQFYTMSDKNQSVKLPVTNKKRSCTSDMGCDNIYNGDTIYVEGYNDAFRATIYDNAIQYSIPYV
jgi:hypothetical protein